MRSVRRGAGIVLLLLGLVVGLGWLHSRNQPRSAHVRAAHARRSVRGPFLLALGDSLAVGVQPNPAGFPLPTDHGYVDDLLTRMRPYAPGLTAIKLGCPGESSHSMLTGTGNRAAVHLYRCDVAGGSQLAAALTELRRAGGAVRVVVLDVGTNDIVGCLGLAARQMAPAATRICLRRAGRTLTGDLAHILRALHRAVAPGTPIVNATLYAPFLDGQRLAAPAVRRLAALAAPLVSRINADIIGVDTAGGIRTADVAGAFHTAATGLVRTPGPGGRLPVDLLMLCRYTWSCARPPAGPNLHPNRAGYAAMADAYARALGVNVKGAD